MTEHVRTEFEGGVLTLTLDRPEKKNALTEAMYGALADGLARADADPQVGAVLITGAGGVFTAGNDLADFMAVATGAPTGAADLRERQVGRFLDRLARLEAPLVAAVPGLAIGVGATLLLHCDLVYLAETAQLATPFADLALVPEAGSSRLMPGRIGHVRAFAMFTLGERVGAAEAAAMGLANAVLPAEALQPHARAAAQALCAKPREAVRRTKALMRDPAATTALIEAEAQVFAAQLKSPEAAQAFRAFAERRR